MKKEYGFDPNYPFPISDYNGICYLKNIVKKPYITVGDYTYYDDFENPLGFENNVLYDFAPDQRGKLVIGKFCAIATGVKFILNGANHWMDCISTYPFCVFKKG